MMAAERTRSKVQPPARERNGRLKRPTLAQMKARERDAYQVEMRTVLAQPHRQGSDHPWRSSALGLFCLAHKIRSELYDAAEEYAKIVHRWRLAKGVPVTVGLGESARITGSPSDRTVHDWEKRIAEVERALAKKSPEHLSAIRWLVLDDHFPQMNTYSTSIEGLLILANTLGWKIGAHPYA